ncbi:MAG: PEP-CTERM sorting domain-containing protein [Syntrophobacter sp.]
MKNINKIKLLTIWLCTGFIMLGMMSSANALLIDPTTTTPLTTGNQTSTKEITAAITAYIGSSTEYYKQNAGGTEEGALSGSYETTFGPSGSSDGYSSAVISCVGGPFISGDAFLLVKDGNATPAWYLFDLTALGWTGTDTIQLSGFWRNVPGAISHVTLYGGGTAVPEPSTILLLGGGLLALAACGKRFRKA